MISITYRYWCTDILHSDNSNYRVRKLLYYSKIQTYATHWPNIIYLA